MIDFICKIASVEEINLKWDYEITANFNDNRWVIWKQDLLNAINDRTRLCYYGILNGKIITEATAIISPNDKTMQNKDGLIDEDTAYINAFRTIEEYQGQGYFSKLYKFMENDLKKRGFTKLTLGVEPYEVKNQQIYFNWGFNNFVKTAFEIYPPQNENEESEKIMVNYYMKKLK